MSHRAKLGEGVMGSMSEHPSLEVRRELATLRFL